MKDLHSTQHILHALILNLKATVVTYTHRFAANRVRVELSDSDPNSEEDFWQSEPPLDKYLKQLQDELRDDFDEEFFREIYKVAFCAQPRSQFSIHIRSSYISGGYVSPNLNIYIDTEQIVAMIVDKYKSNHSSQLLGQSSIYQGSSRESNLFGVKYEVKVQPNDNALAILKQKKEWDDYHFLLQVGAVLSISLSLIAIALVCLAIVSLAPGLAVGIGLALFSGFLFFQSTKKPPVASLADLPEAEIIDLQQAFAEHYKTNTISIEVIDERHCEAGSSAICSAGS